MKDRNALLEAADVAVRRAYDLNGADSVAWAVIAVAHVLAAGEIDRLEEATSPEWGRIEFFGHAFKYGRVTEVRFGGRTFLEVVEPETLQPVDPDGESTVQAPETRKTYHPNAVYAFKPMSEADVMDALHQQRGDIPF